MENSDILIYILAVIGVVVSAVVKSSKKKAEEARRLHRPGTDDKSYDTYHVPDIKDVTHSRGGYQPQTTQAKTYWSYDQETINAHESSPRIDDINRRAMDSTAEEITMDGAFDQSVNHVVPEISGFSHRHFNLRDAIIYSELLKPKHEEY